MRTQVLAQRDFSAGQIDDAALRSDDTLFQRAGCRIARNVRILTSRSLKRRPGRVALFQTTGISEIVRPLAGSEWHMVFEPGAAMFIKRDLSARVRFDGQPWTAAQLTQLRWVEDGGTVIVAHQSFSPRVFTFNKLTGIWGSGAFAFALDPNGTRRAPFYNFSLGSGVTMQPSARTGSVTLTFSGAVMQPGHVGVIMRYAERQMVITAVANGFLATATVTEELPPTMFVNVDNVTGLQVGDVIEGITSGTKAQVTEIFSATQFVCLVSKNWSGFSGTEFIVGPRSRMTFVSFALSAPAATALWDEELISSLRGWPGNVSKDQRRIIFNKFAQAGPAIVWSATGTLNDFKVGAQKDDAIFEFVPENCTVLDVVGGADEFVFTDRGTYYVPVSTANPLIAGSIEFRLISDDPSCDVRPRQTTDGLVFLNATKTRMFGLIGTGQSARPYIIEDLSENNTNVIDKPVALAVTSTDASAPERYLYCANIGGDMAVARYQRQQQGRGWVGWVPWDGVGLVKWVAADGDLLTATVEYATPAGPVRFVEAFDETAILDCSQLVNTVTGGTALALISGGYLELAGGGTFDLVSNLRLAPLAGVEVSVEQSGWYRGLFMVNNDGSLPADVPVLNALDLRVGFSFTAEVEPFLQHAEPGDSQRQRMRPRRIKQVSATFLRTQAVEVAGRLVPFYLAGENNEDAPPMRSETYKARVLGRDYDPRWSIKQDLPGGLHIVEMTTEITI
jgi:hypothetical protein